MILPKGIEAAAATESEAVGRRYLTNVRVDVAMGLAEATNGKILARVPVDVDPGEGSQLPRGGSVLVPADLARTAWTKGVVRGYIYAIGGNGSAELATNTKGGGQVRATIPDETFPDTKSMIPDSGGDDLILDLDARLLARLAKALGTERLTMRFRLSGFVGGGRMGEKRYVQGIRVESDDGGGVGVIMPLWRSS